MTKMWLKFSKIMWKIIINYYKPWFGTEGYAVVTKGSVRFWTKIIIFLKSGWEYEKCENKVVMQRIKVETLGVAIEKI